jgi:hypothetical protein
VIIDRGRLVAESTLNELVTGSSSLEDVFLELTTGALA